MAIVGFKDEQPFLVAVGHPDGLPAAQARPQSFRAYSLERIKGLAEAAEDDGFVRASR